MKKQYLILAIVGTIVPYIFFLQHFSNEGLSIFEFIKAPFAIAASSGFTSDLLISSFVFWVWMFYRQAKSKGPNPIIFIALNLLIGLSCALPAYLYMTDKTVEK